MEKLLKIAGKVCDQAEVYAIHTQKNEILFENENLKTIDRSVQSGVTLRIIRDDKLGFSYTKNLDDRETLVQNTLDTLIGGAEAPETLPGKMEIANLNTQDSAAETVTSKTLAGECRRVYDRFRKKTGGQFIATASFANTHTRILNSMGVDLEAHSSEYRFLTMLLFPGSLSRIEHAFSGKRFFKTPDESIARMASLFIAGGKEVWPPGGRMKVLFLPRTFKTLLIRLAAGVNGQMIFQGQSPLGRKIGEKIFDAKLTVRDMPLADAYPGARAFDDEGTPCRPLTLVEDGVMKNIYADRFYAGKLGITPTGHGYKAVGVGDPVSYKPTPVLQHLMVEPGDKSFSDMVESIDAGIIVATDIGSHTGDVPAGDFSIGLSPGLYVEGGHIKGQVKDTIVAGNIYGILNNILAIENRQHTTGAPWGGLWHWTRNWRCPAILVDNVNVVTK